MEILSVRLALLALAGAAQGVAAQDQGGSTPIAEKTVIAPSAGTSARPDLNGLLSNGTEVELMVLKEVSSARSKPGELMKLRVNRAIMVGNKAIIPVGALAFGRVETVEKSKAALGSGRLAAKLSYIQWRDMQIKLQGEFNMRGVGGKNDDLVKAVFVPVYALFSPGNSAKLRAGEILLGHVLGDYPLTGEDGELRNVIP